MGKFHQIFMELSAWDKLIFSFPDDNFTKQELRQAGHYTPVASNKM